MIGYKLDPAGFPGLKMTIKGIERLYGKPAKQAAPITIDILVNIGLSLNLDRKFHIAVCPIFLTSFILLRKSHNIFLKQKHLVRPKDGYEVLIKWPKTTQFTSRVKKLPLLPIKGSLLCPVAALD